MSNFSLALAFILKNEGGYSDVRQDKGGPTNFGITLAELARWRGHPVSKFDVRDMLQPEADAIYEAWYWQKLSLDDVESQLVATMMFDQAINRGVGTVAKQVQEIVGVNPDGKIGPKSVQAINNCAEIALAVRLIKSTQIAYAKIVASDPTQRIFIVGWINRSHRLFDLLIGESLARPTLHS